MSMQKLSLLFILHRHIHMDNNGTDYCEICYCERNGIKIISPCRHTMCRERIMKVSGKSYHACPICRTELNGIYESSNGPDGYTESVEPIMTPLRESAHLSWEPSQWVTLDIMGMVPDETVGTSLLHITPTPCQICHCFWAVYGLRGCKIHQLVPTI